MSIRMAWPLMLSSSTIRSRSPMRLNRLRKPPTDTGRLAMRVERVRSVPPGAGQRPQRNANDWRIRIACTHHHSFATRERSQSRITHLVTHTTPHTMALRSSRTLLNEVKYASPHKYHYVEGKTPFWRKFREIFSANPYISSGLPLPDHHRQPRPGSRPETDAATTPSRASDIAGNRYYERDFRRKYPALDMITQEHLTKLLLAAPNEDGTKTCVGESRRGGIRCRGNRQS